MRLNPFDTSKIKVRGGGGGMRRAGGVGCGTIVIAIIGAVVFGIDPMQTIGMVEGVQQQTAPQTQQANVSEEQLCSSSAYATEACNALQSLNETWQPEFARANVPFQQPELVLYPSGRVTTQGCGTASSAAGPFYCPADYGIYIDTSFYDQLAQMAGTGGDFARLYVMAHEYGHHIQNLTGLAGQVRSLQQRSPSRSNDLQVRMELQADCYAGVWAGKNRSRIEPGDMEEGLRAASAIGDDTLQRRSGQRINPENFTHGTSQQRMNALRRGLETADDTVCDTYFDFR
ncbi:KPN_02809 family neutral zinc metallopeptidase [Erythrobacter rubeus]|uniref:Neutral zinc metallopeptidase n=1 Tax=Erythrobacter rubeus TaxID=2760803 RepID=A0ABR8KM94_9SPHN|nr:neutral zinc metallopeptidase [Erythrobacter rubeus]MBD2841626.1 neutral zinc metallopeptidase [Erythrobacter rubeus]